MDTSDSTSSAYTGIGLADYAKMRIINSILRMSPFLTEQIFSLFIQPLKFYRFDIMLPEHPAIHQPGHMGLADAPGEILRLWVAGIFVKNPPPQLGADLAANRLGAPFFECLRSCGLECGEEKPSVALVTGIESSPWAAYAIEATGISSDQSKSCRNRIESESLTK